MVLMFLIYIFYILLHGENVLPSLLPSSRLHPVAVSLQRYITEDIAIQNYHIPSGVRHGFGIHLVFSSICVCVCSLQIRYIAMILTDDISYYINCKPCL